MPKFFSLLSIIFIFLAITSPTFAVTARYYPGETLNPDCAPTEEGCTVLGLSYATSSSELVNPGYQISSWGDSLTAGYTPYLAAILGPVYNGGVGSETANQIRDRMVAATSTHSSITVIWVGANNNMANAGDIQIIEDNIATMVADLSTDRYVVISAYISSSFSSTSPEYIQMKALNSYLSNTYQGHYLDIRSYLVNQYNPDTELAYYNNDIVPPSIRFDHIHLTSAGYLKVAQQIANFIEQQYYVSNSNSIRQSDLLSIFSAPYAIGSATSAPAKFTNITITGKGDDTAHLSRELVDSTGWATTSNWSGNYVAGFTHNAVAGATTTLSRVVLPNIVSQTVLDKKYQISFTMSATAGSVAVSFADVDNASFVYTVTPRTFYFSPTAASTTGNLIFTPTADFNGTISNISVKEISTSYPAPLSLLDTLGNSFLDIRGSGSALLGNIFMGPDSGKYNVTGSGNTSLGTNALVYNTSGNYNTGVGLQSLYNNTTGNSNTATGYSSLGANTIGLSNTANGVIALSSNTSGNYNTAVGMSALSYNTTASNNTAVGFESLRLNTTGLNNTSVGFKSLYSNATGTHNTANGAYSLNSNLGSFNTANGAFSMYFNTSGLNNSAYGYNTLYVNTTGYQNSAFGSGALYNSLGYSNTAVGYNASGNNSTGNENTAVGDSALMQNTTGPGNTVMGVGAMRWGTATGTTAFGYQAGYGSSPAAHQYNAFFGDYAGRNILSGTWNTMVGTFAGYGLSSGANNSTIDSYLTLIGAQSSRDDNNPSAVAITKSTAIGYNAKVGGSYMMALGGTSTSAVLVGIGTSTPNAYLNVFGSSSVATLVRVATSTNQNVFVVANTGSVGVGTSAPAFKFQVYIDGSNEGHVASNGAWAQTSDENLKKNILTLEGSLDKIMQLRGVRYDWKTDELATSSSNIGFIAQEVEKIFPQFVDTGSNGIKGVSYGSFTPVLLQAIKEIQTGILGFKDKIVSALGDFVSVHSEIGLTTKDKITGEDYCMYMSNGVMQSAKGTCEEVNGTPSAQTSNTVSDPNSSLIIDTATTTDPVATTTPDFVETTTTTTEQIADSSQDSASSTPE